MRVELAGALSVGKSTLARLLEDMGVRIVREDLSTNPYLALRLEDPEKYDFLCQRQFVFDKIASIGDAISSGGPFACDFSLAAERAYVSHYVAHRPDWIGELSSLMDASEREHGLPDLVVHLRCAPEEQLARIARRGRDFEQGHDVAFVDTINRLVDGQVERLAELGVPVLSFRTDQQTWPDIALGILRTIGAARTAGPQRSVDTLSLKWGKAKEWSLNSPSARAAGQKYIDLEAATPWRKWDGSEAQKHALCEIVDAVDCDVVNDWNGSVFTKDEAKRFIMLGGQPL